MVQFTNDVSPDGRCEFVSEIGLGVSLSVVSLSVILRPKMMSR